ncbi:MAG: hypothetical protein JWO69_590 [Thermoleophilia bacterium]|nr:hypothetical protein [Thermoleophilia bacterium]
MTTIAPTSPMLARAAATPTFADDPYDPVVIAERVKAGRHAELTADTLPDELVGRPADELVGRPAPSYFRTYEQLKSALYELEAAYPDLVEVRDIGDTEEKVAGKADRDILALVLRNKGSDGDLPKTLHVGGIHAREIANPELLMTFATQLLQGHGRDPEATMLLDSRETIIVPMLNPDGHAVVERGFANEAGGNTMQRKNTDAGNPKRGTDLNRNYDYHWGGAGASSNPRSETYHGPAVASAAEIEAVQQFILDEKPDAVFDWHSYSMLNLYPPSDSRVPTKDDLAFRAIAQKFTTFNGHSPIPAIELYATTGTTDAFVYDKLGVPAMTIETGTAFHQTDKDFARTLQLNLPVLTYAVKIADAPFARVFGPDAMDVVVDPATRQLQARLTDANNGKQAIAGAELVFSADAEPGSGVALQAADGAFDSVDELVTGTATDAAAGSLVYVRGHDAAGNWGPLAAQWATGPART